MASTFSTNLRFEKQADGENPNSWGLILNQNVIDLVDQAITSYTTVALNTNSTTGYALTANNGSTDTSRSAFLEITGAVSSTVSITIPSLTKGYFINNKATQAVADKNIVIKTATGTGYILPYGSNINVVTDSVSVYPGINSTGLGLGTAAVRNIGTSVSAVPDVSIADARYAKVSSANTFTGANTFVSANTYTGINSFNKQVISTIVTLTDAASVTLDLATGNNFLVQLGGNRTLQNPTNVKVGQIGQVYLVQDGTGSRTLSYGSQYNFPAGTAPTLSTSVNSVDMLVFSARTTTALDCVLLKEFS
tara:strand:- start:810 stop:1730 length:921 start_codon:yes stop_codon:yes gene_type:complete